ncbi:phosphatase PAP2 family protein [Hydrogenophaga aromaticivorans]|uniref:phosphatase PAP2 family protein n=1 Tax=Hydrogenophaga aromaticivorans TaxID=2610898 RepID=UPI001B364046|nr:phosphatase PAP2 family protein [Hydrogenophaga aromaticivorans]MBQ0919153.1 phosphatase PAP2 family protein [Hydrogenophaga aromaticivorans]
MVSSDALILSRAAIVGPFTGASLHATEPGFDEPANLKLWADGPRVTACFTELVEGLLFRTRNGPKEALLEFANLQARNIQREPLVRLRAPTKAQFKKQLDLVAAYADLRADRAAEVVAQLTPPLAFFSSMVGLTAHRHKKTLQLLDLVFALCLHVEMRFKHVFASLRPEAFSPQIQPMIQTPGHGSWPSGHATEAFAFAVLLEALLNAASAEGVATPNGTASHEQLQRLAARIAVNRTVAGVHFPVDSAAGRLLGTALAEFLVARATGKRVHERGFDGRLFQGANGEALDFSLHQKMDGPHRQAAYTRSATSTGVGNAPLLTWLWEEAIKEWQ